MLKAIRKQPSERYATADALMEDLQRYVSARPVQARPDSLRYRCVQFVRRHRGALAIAASLGVAIALGVAGTLSQAHNARRARDSALKELVFAEASEEFMRLILTGMSGRQVTPTELLTHADAIVATKYSHDPELKARMQLVLSDLFNEQCDAVPYHEVLSSAEPEPAMSPDRESAPTIATMPTSKLFLCLRDLGAGSERTRELAAVRDRDRAAEAKHGVRYKAYWVGEQEGKIYSLAEAPSAAAALAAGWRDRGVVADNVIEVTADNMNWTPTPGRKLYMDIHQAGASKLTAKDLAEGHRKDVVVGIKYDVKFLNYWFDASVSTTMCLIEAPSAEAALAVHREAHGFMPVSIEEVTEVR